MRRSICELTKPSARRELRLAGISTSTTADVHIRVLTAAPRIKPTSTRCHSAWQPKPGRGSTYRRGDFVQTSGTSSGPGLRDRSRSQAPRHRPKTASHCAVLEDPFQPSHAEKRISSSYLRRIAIRTRLSDSVRLVAEQPPHHYRKVAEGSCNNIDGENQDHFNRNCAPFLVGMRHC
jgi:hypothetical protein